MRVRGHEACAFAGAQWAPRSRDRKSPLATMATACPPPALTARRHRP
jgi:hypothetical protein